ncbi:MAG: polysaccharide biosynthesis C-terminal domain-containing protein [bacterium]|nr:polysaccharide biosynthesis C-terminal domain-containing protein [Candidatus Kapabacteria bacterium]
MRRRFRASTQVGVGADTALSTLMTALATLGNYLFTIVVFNALAGKEEAGIYGLTITFLTVGSSIADFGLNATIMPRVSMARGPNTPALRAATILRLGAIAVAWIGLNVYLHIFGPADLVLYVNLAFLGIFVSSRITGLRQMLEMLWRLKGRAYVAIGFSVLDSLLALAIVVVIGRAGNIDVATVMMVWTIAALPGFVLLLVPLLPSLRKAVKLWQPLPGRYYKTLFIATLPVAAMAFSGQVAAQLETFVLSWAGTIADVGEYRVASSPAMGLIFIPVVISVGLAPVISQMYRSKRAELTMEQLISIGTRLTATIGLGLCVLCVLFADQIMGIFPAHYASGAYILRLYSVIIALVFIVVALDQYLLAVGKRRQVFVSSTVNLVLSIALEIPMILMYGIRGMMAAKIVAVVATIGYQVAALPGEMRSGAIKGLMRMIGPAAAFAVCVVATPEMSLPLRAGVTLTVVIASVVLFGTVRLGELNTLRRLRLT